MKAGRFWALLLLGLGACSNGDGNGDGGLQQRKVAVCRQVFQAGCETFVRCGAFPASTDCAGLTQMASEMDLADCTADLVDEFTQAEVDTCAADMRIIQCQNLCGIVPQDPPSCQQLDPTPNTEVIECTY